MRTAAAAVVEAVLDGGSFTPWDQPGLAVLVGEGTISGSRVAVIVSDFDVLAGSVGVAESLAIVATVSRATAQGLPVLAAPSSGGMRMQEGAVAFAQMRSIARAIGAHRAAGLPFVVWLRDPTFGGVFASWASLGHITAAEPDASIGFLGPRVYQALAGRPFPDGVQVSANLLSRGLVDAVIPLADLKSWLACLLSILRPQQPEPRRSQPGDTTCSDDTGPAWDSVLRSARPDRPGVRDVLRLAEVEFVELSGSGRGETSKAVVLGLARLGAGACVLVGQDRGAQRDGHLIGPGALRVVRRGIELAGQLRLPIVTVVDTVGAELSPASEQGGLSKEIASCLLELGCLEQHSVCVILGEGTGGAALALASTKRVVAARHAWLAPLPLAGASEIQYRNATRAADVAEQQRVRASCLMADGVVDAVVDERPDAADEPEAFSRRVVAAVERELSAPPRPALAEFRAV